MKPSPTENDTGWTKNEEQLIIDQAPTLIYTGRPDGFLDFFNQRWLEYLGVGQEEVEGWQWINVIHPDDVDEIVGKWRASLLFRWDLVLLVSLSSADVEELWSRSRDVLDVDVNRYPGKYFAVQSGRTAFFAPRPSPAPQRRHLRADDRAGRAWCCCLSPSVLPSGTGTCGFQPFPGDLAAT